MHCYWAKGNLVEPSQAQTVLTHLHDYLCWWAWFMVVKGIPGDNFASRNPLWSCYSKCGLQTSRVRIIWELVRICRILAPFQNYSINQKCIFMKSPGDSHTLQFVKQPPVRYRTIYSQNPDFIQEFDCPPLPIKLITTGEVRGTSVQGFPPRHLLQCLNNPVFHLHSNPFLSLTPKRFNLSLAGRENA